MVAGEVSGDLLGGKLAKELFKHSAVTTISGIGGDTMRQANVNTLYDVSETSVVGIAEILKHYPRLRIILSNIKRHLKHTKPDLLILIDYPEFNLKLAKYAKSLGIKVLFYVSPQIWAWRTYRVKKIKLCVDLMAVLFPFEVEFYKQAGIPVILVRHPLLEDIDQHYSANNSNADKILTIGLAPGSRPNEIKKLFPIMLNTANLLKKDHPNIRFICPVAPGVDIATLESYENKNINIEYIQCKFYETINLCDAVAISSGTATLQTALMGKPMVVLYKVSPVTYKLFGHMIKVKHISLANIILQRRAYTELIQASASVENLYSAFNELINDSNINNKMQSYREQIYKQLDKGINSQELASRAANLTMKD